MNKQQENITDENLQLLRASAAGDKQAFHTLYQLTHKKVYAYLVRRLQDKSLADEILVDTYTEVWKNAAKFRAESQLDTWIIGIARNLAMNRLKRQKYHDDIENHADLSQQENLQLETAEIQQIMHKAILQLAENHREILGLILLPEYSYQQISTLLDVPLNTVKTRVYYAKNALKKVLISMGVNDNDI